MKPEIRILGIDDSSYNKNRQKRVLVIGTLFRGGGFMDGVMSCKVIIDGDDATEKISDMILKSKFKVQLRAILFDGIAVGGFNVIDIEEFNETTKIPVIVIMRDYPDINKIKNTLIHLNMPEKIELIEKAGKIYPFEKIHFQIKGIEKSEAEHILKITCTHSFIPEPIRIAHLIGQGICMGESKGRA